MSNVGCFLAGVYGLNPSQTRASDSAREDPKCCQYEATRVIPISLPSSHLSKAFVPLAAHHTDRPCEPLRIRPSFIRGAQFHDNRLLITQRFVPPITSPDLSLSLYSYTAGFSLDVLTIVSRHISRFGRWPQVRAP